MHQKACLVFALALALGLAGSLGCGHSIEASVRRDQLGTKYAALSGYFATRGAAPGGTHVEQTPGDIRHDVLLDEAILAAATAGETCVDVVIRTDSAHDEPLAQLAPAFEIDGQKQRGVIESELISVYDYRYSGQREVVSIEGVTADAFLGLSITEPTENVFRVIERTGRICAGVGGAPRKVALDLTNPSWDVADYNYYVNFIWSIS